MYVTSASTWSRSAQSSSTSKWRSCCPVGGWRSQLGANRLLVDGLCSPRPASRSALPMNERKPSLEWMSPTTSQGRSRRSRRRPKGILAPATGRPVRANDPYFLPFPRSITSSPTRGSSVAAPTPHHLGAHRSLMLMTFGLACCAVEICRFRCRANDVPSVFGFARAPRRASSYFDDRGGHTLTNKRAPARRKVYDQNGPIRAL